MAVVSNQVLMVELDSFVRRRPRSQAVDIDIHSITAGPNMWPVPFLQFCNHGIKCGSDKALLATRMFKNIEARPSITLRDVQAGAVVFPAQRFGNGRVVVVFLMIRFPA